MPSVIRKSKEKVVKQLDSGAAEPMPIPSVESLIQAEGAWLGDEATGRNRYSAVAESITFVHGPVTMAHISNLACCNLIGLFLLQEYEDILPFS